MAADKREIMRYLSAGKMPQEQLDTWIDRAVALSEEVVRPKSVSGKFSCEAGPDGVTVDGVFFVGKSLGKNLSGCRQVFLMAATLGTEADLLLRREAQRGALHAAVMQAVLTERIERECDRVQQSLAETLETGWKLRPRFSLGYGDTLLSDQKAFFSLLPVTKRTGVTLSDGFLMTPTKSVTALIGIIKQETEKGIVR